jgi:hypothetical protein
MTTKFPEIKFNNWSFCFISYVPNMWIMSNIQILINFKAYLNSNFNLDGLRFLWKTMKSLNGFLTKLAFHKLLRHNKRVNFSILMK